MLATGERHGYGIRQDVLEHTDGRIELEAGNLYRHIRRLELDQLVEPSPRKAEADGDARRIYYRMTPFGRRVLAAEMFRMRELVRLGEARRIIAPLPA